VTSHGFFVIGSDFIGSMLKWPHRSEMCVVFPDDEYSISANMKLLKKVICRKQAYIP